VKGTCFKGWEILLGLAADKARSSSGYLETEYMVTLVFKPDPLMPGERATRDAVSMEQAENSAVETVRFLTKGHGRRGKSSTGSRLFWEINGYTPIKMAVVQACECSVPHRDFEERPERFSTCLRQATPLKIAVRKGLQTRNSERSFPTLRLGSLSCSKSLYCNYLQMIHGAEPVLHSHGFRSRINMNPWGR
jgi:hypothetical protein